MNKIGFKNFRRFVDFEPIEFKGITFLVGRNNSGKSTVVKALLLIINYLKADKIDTLDFNENNVEDVNIVTFGRALNRKAKDNLEDAITFFLEMNGLRIQLTITSEEPNSTEIDVIDLIIEDIKSGYIFSIKPKLTSISITINPKIDEIQNQKEISILTTLKANEKELKQRIKLSDKNSEFIMMQIEELKQIKKFIKLIHQNIKIDKTSSQFILESSYNKYSKLEDILQDSINRKTSHYEFEYHVIQKERKTPKKQAEYKAFLENTSKIEKIISSIIDFQRQVENVYLGASLNKQSALFAIRDKNNALAQAIHEFNQLKITSGETAYSFVEEWMEKFDIGQDFEIDMHAGEAYEMKISSNDMVIPLADKGMGSIQAMLLILRLAVIIYKKQKYGKLYTIIIEEPELNLHPALQSKLADLFLEVYEKYSINFIVETHSEYILRRSQVIVAVNEYEISPNENPFYVHYFPKELQQMPYRLEYQEDGSFIRNFGNGFFDEASASTLELLKLKRQKKS